MFLCYVYNEYFKCKIHFQKQLVDKLVVVDVSPIKMPESSYVSIPLYMVAMQEAVLPLQNVGIVQARKLVDEHLAQSIPVSI